LADYSGKKSAVLVPDNTATGAATYDKQGLLPRGISTAVHRDSVKFNPRQVEVGGVLVL